MGTEMRTKRFKNQMSKNTQNMSRNGAQNCLQDAPGKAKNRPKVLYCRRCLRLSPFSKMSTKRRKNGPPRGLNMRPKRLQHGPEEGPKRGPNGFRKQAPKKDPKRDPTMVPKGPNRAPNGRQEGPQKGPERIQKGVRNRSPNETPKMGPARPNNGPTWPQNGPQDA